MKRSFALGLYFVMFASCELVVDVDVPFEGREMVLNSFITPDSVFSARVSLNKFILDDAPFQLVSDATVTVQAEGTTIDTLMLQLNGFYRSDKLKPEIGKTYTVEVVHPQYGEIRGTSKIPDRVPVAVEDFNITVDGMEDGNISFTLTFDDPDAIQNFYQVEMHVEERYTNPQTQEGFMRYNSIYVWSDDTAIDSEEIPNHEGFFFSDVLFDGSQTKILVKGRYYQIYGATERKFFIYFKSVNEAYFRYKRTALLQEYVREDPFAQPVKVFNNVENGFGIVGGFSQWVEIIEK